MSNRRLQYEEHLISCERHSSFSGIYIKCIKSTLASTCVHYAPGCSWYSLMVARNKQTNNNNKRILSLVIISQKNNAYYRIQKKIKKETRKSVKMTNYNSQEKDSPIKISRANESRLVVSTFLENPSFLKRSSRKRPVSFMLSTFLYLTLYHQYTGKI